MRRKPPSSPKVATGYSGAGERRRRSAGDGLSRRLDRVRHGRYRLVMRMTAPRRIHLLDADPELGQLLQGQRLVDARRELVCRVHTPDRGPWDAERLRTPGPSTSGCCCWTASWRGRSCWRTTCRPSCSARATSCARGRPSRRRSSCRAEVRWTIVEEARLRGARPPLRRPARALSRGQRDGHRPPDGARAAARHDAGDLAAQRRRAASAGAVLAPQRALGPRGPARGHLDAACPCRTA